MTTATEKTTVTALQTHPEVARARAALQRALGDPAAGAAHAPLARAADALESDPTLVLTRDGQYRWDCLSELVRQLKLLARQAALARAGGPGKVNPQAPRELDALVVRIDQLVDQITAAARPDWDTPAHRAALAEAVLPADHTLATIAAALRSAAGPAAALAPDHPRVRELLALADRITGAVPARCVRSAADARARERYGHLEGQMVWLESRRSPGSLSLGSLHLPDDTPGYLYLARGDADRSKTVHVDDVLRLIPDADKRAQEEKATAQARREHALELLEARKLQERITVETADGQVVTGLLLDYSDHHLWLHRHDVEGVDRDAPWRAPLGRVRALTGAP
ncbi:hypothetical protein [Nocardiopsis flavescens]